MPSWQEMLRARRGEESDDDTPGQDEAAAPAEETLPQVCSAPASDQETEPAEPQSVCAHEFSVMEREAKPKVNRRELQAKRLRRKSASKDCNRVAQRKGSDLKGKAGLSESRRGTEEVPAGQSWQDVLSNVLAKRGCTIPMKVEVPVAQKATTAAAQSISKVEELRTEEASLPEESPQKDPPIELSKVAAQPEFPEVHASEVEPSELDPSEEVMGAKVHSDEAAHSASTIVSSTSTQNSPSKARGRLARAGIQPDQTPSPAKASPSAGKSSGRALRAFSPSPLKTDAEQQRSQKESESFQQSTQLKSSSSVEHSTEHSIEVPIIGVQSQFFAGRSSFGPGRSSFGSDGSVNEMSKSSLGGDNASPSGSKSAQSLSEMQTPPGAANGDFAWEMSSPDGGNEALGLDVTHRKCGIDNTAASLSVESNSKPVVAVEYDIAETLRSSFGLSAAEAARLRDVSFGPESEVSALEEKRSSFQSSQSTSSAHGNESPPSPRARSSSDSSSSKRAPDPMSLTITSSGGPKKDDLDRSFFMPLGLGIDRPQSVNEKEKAFNDIQRIEARLFASELREEELWKLVRDNEEELNKDPEKRKLLMKLHSLMAVRKLQRSEVTPQYLQNLKNTAKASAILGSYNGVMPDPLRNGEKGSLTPSRSNSNCSTSKDQIIKTAVHPDGLAVSTGGKVPSSSGYPDTQHDRDIDNSFFLPQRFKNGDQLSNTKRTMDDFKRIQSIQ